MATRTEVYEALDSERAYQLSLAEGVSGDGTGEHVHSAEEFVLYMEDYLAQARTQLSRMWTPTGIIPEALDTIRKVTALGVACLEQNGVRRRDGF